MTPKTFAPNGNRIKTARIHAKKNHAEKMDRERRRFEAAAQSPFTVKYIKNGVEGFIDLVGLPRRRRRTTEDTQIDYFIIYLCKPLAVLEIHARLLKAFGDLKHEVEPKKPTKEAS